MTIASGLLSRLGAVLGQDGLRTGPDDLATYGRDWTRFYEPSPLAIALPRTSAEVLEVVRACREARTPIVPSGGRTGLSGGAVARARELVVSLERMRKLEPVDVVDGSVRCEAGVTTQQLQEHARAAGLYYPVDFASRGTSHVGGNIATNAGGIHVLRYGMTRDWVRGLTVVTGRGDLLELNRGLVKNATGYDFRHLFIGSEGTLGIITAATMALTRPPGPLQVAVLALSDLDAVMRVFSTLSARLALRAFEMFSDAALGLVLSKAQLPAPMQQRHPWYVLVETELTESGGDDAVLAALASCVEEELASDIVIAQSPRQASELWRLREDISEACAPHTPYKNDVAVTVSAMPALLTELQRILSQAYPDFPVIYFGHVGDGNLHINILKPKQISVEQFVSSCVQVDELVYSVVEKLGGAISAEHGVGLTKRTALRHSRSRDEIELMRGVKAVFDPDGIMNPGKLLV